MARLPLVRCCCCNLKTGTQIIALLGYGSLLLNQIISGYIPEYGSDTIKNSVYSIKIASAAIGLVVSSFLIAAATKKRRIFALPWLICTAIGLLFGLLIDIVVIIIIHDVGIRIILGVSSLIGFPIYIYFWLVVFSFYKELKDKAQQHPSNAGKMVDMACLPLPLLRCCCCNLKTGTQIIAILFMLAYGTLLLAAIILRSFQYDSGSISQSNNADMITPAVVGLVVSSFLIAGTANGKTVYLLPWLISMGIFLVLSFPGSIILMIFHPEFILSLASSSLVVYPLFIYSWLIVFSFYKELKDKKAALLASPKVEPSAEANV